MQDLWADYTGEALPTGTRGRGGGTRQRRLTEQAVLTELRAWLLQEYLLPYATSLGATRIFQRCYWIDGLGSTHSPAHTIPAPTPDVPVSAPKRGRQKNQASLAALPPALQPVATLAQQLAQLERPIALHGFVLDGKVGKRKTTGAASQTALHRAQINTPAQPTPNSTQMDTLTQTVKKGARARAAKPPASAQPGNNGASARAALNGAQTGEMLPIPPEGGLLPATWPELAPELLTTLGQSAAVFLLDPLKDGLLRYTDLAPLYQRTAPTELFLWLSHKQIETRLLPTLRTGEGAAALTNLLRGDRWKRLLTSEQDQADPQRLIDGLIQLCLESMRPHFLSVQRLYFPIHSGPAHVVDAPCTLLFATRRLDSLASLNDAICQRTRRLVVASQQNVLTADWFTHQRAEQSAAAWEALAQETLALGRAQRVRRWPDLRQQLLLTHFGQHPLHEYDQIITTLLARGNVSCEWQPRPPSQETTTTPLPGPGDLLLWR